MRTPSTGSCGHGQEESEEGGVCLETLALLTPILLLVLATFILALLPLLLGLHSTGAVQQCKV